MTVTATYGTGKYIEGSVGGLIGADYTAENRYGWGIFAYPVTFSGQELNVITYWVD